MLAIGKMGKFLIAIVLSISLISVNYSKVLADEKSPVNTKQQVEFLEEKRKSQGLILEEKRESSMVEGMMTSRDVENRRKAEIEREDEIKRKERDQEDIFSEVVESVRKLQEKRRESKKLADEKKANEKSVKKESQADDGYKKSETPIVENTTANLEEIQASEPVANVISEIKEDTGVNSLPEKVEITKDLIATNTLHKDPIDMSDSDIEMLERIVMAESGGEPYLGQIAVANVVLNRVKSKSYPSTLEGVIFQRFQFSPVKNGVIRGQAPNESVKKAVAEALNGRMVVAEDTLYFVNPVLATDQTVPRTKTIVKVIGNHTFYR